MPDFPLDPIVVRAIRWQKVQPGSSLMLGQPQLRLRTAMDAVVVQDPVGEPFVRVLGQQPLEQFEKQDGVRRSASVVFRAARGKRRRCGPGGTISILFIVAFISPPAATGVERHSYTLAQTSARRFRCISRADGPERTYGDKQGVIAMPFGQVAVSLWFSGKVYVTRAALSGGCLLGGADARDAAVSDRGGRDR
jgi:hypothetical protein